MESVLSLLRENSTIAAAIAAVIVILILRKFIVWAVIVAGIVFVSLYYLYGKISAPF